MTPPTDVWQKHTLETMRQGVSYDCGFFCGYALHLATREPFGFHRIQFSQQDVYLIREASRGGGSGQQITEALAPSTKSQSLSGEIAAVDFLKAVGCVGYKPIRTNRDPALIRAVLEQNVKPFGQRAGMMINWNDAHWICVVGTNVSGPQARYLVYNPGSKASGWLSARIEPTLAYLMQNPIHGIVIKGRLPRLEKVRPGRRRID